MARVFLSTLGTTAYEEVSYSPLVGEGPTPATPYIQEARIRALIACDLAPKRVLICVTEGPLGSSEKNWRQRARGRSDTTTEDGLQQRLRALGLDQQIQVLPIPTGNNETELWEIFRVIDEAIEDGDELYVDITHGFRSQPIVLMTALDYLRHARGVEIAQVTYGAYAATKDDTPSPTFDLTPFFVLREWTTALALLETGDLRAIGKRLDSSLKPLSSLLKADTPPSLRNLPKALISLGDTLWNNRLRDLPTHVAALQQVLQAVDSDFANLKTKADKQAILRPMVGALQPLSTVLSRLDSLVAELHPEKQEPQEMYGLLAARFCARNGLMVQALTVLRESLVDHLARVLAPHEVERPEADAILGWMNCPPGTVADSSKIPHSHLLTEPWTAFGGEEAFRGLRAVVARVANRRNTLDHAGTGNSQLPPPEKLHKEAQDLVQKAITIVQNRPR